MIEGMKHDPSLDMLLFSVVGECHTQVPPPSSQQDQVCR
jgi:hypothetical protein